MTDTILTVIDIINPEAGVEISISSYGILWVSIDGITRLRVKAKPEDYTIVDGRCEK